MQYLQYLHKLHYLHWLQYILMKSLVNIIAYYLHFALLKIRTYIYFCRYVNGVSSYIYILRRRKPIIVSVLTNLKNEKLSHPNHH